VLYSLSNNSVFKQQLYIGVLSHYYFLQDVNSSKASLIKSPKDGTPRKKKAKKKVKKPEEGEPETGFDNTLSAELTDLADDIIPHDARRDDEDEEEEQDYKKPYATGSAAVRSQPTEKFYIETDGMLKLFFFYNCIVSKNKKITKKFRDVINFLDFIDK